LATVEAQRRLASAGHRGPKAKAKRDAAAAAVVLQSYLDARAKPAAPFES
jgi:RNase H-fold protein (predicted Holliday junction resolvase)